MQLPAKRIVEGEVVRRIGELKISIEVNLDPDVLRQMVQGLDRTKRRIEELQRKGLVSPLLPSDNVDHYIDGEVTKRA